MSPEAPLSERKRQRAREAIVEAAHELFAERSYDDTTVADIAARAEVGRATFFRYFGDKAEVVFGRDSDIAAILADAASPSIDAPVGQSLPEAIARVRTFVLAYAARLVERPTAYERHEKLVAENPELLARSLTKQRRYVTEMAALLRRSGAEERTATIAAELGLACYYIGRELSDNDPARLVAAIDNAFGRLDAIAD